MFKNTKPKPIKEMKHLTLDGLEVKSETVCVMSMVAFGDRSNFLFFLECSLPGCHPALCSLIVFAHCIRGFNVCAGS